MFNLVNFGIEAGMIRSVLLLGPAPELGLEPELGPEPAPEPDVGPPPPVLVLVLVQLVHSPAVSSYAVAVLVLGLPCERKQPLTMIFCWMRIACSICSCVNCTPTP
jgi:hypothetical protein